MDLQAPEKVIIRILQVFQTVLQRGRIHFLQPFRFRLSFQNRQFPALLRIGQILPFLPIRKEPFIQKPVIDIPATSECLFDQLPLFLIRIQDPFEGHIDRILFSVLSFPLHLSVRLSFNDRIISLSA